MEKLLETAWMPSATASRPQYDDVITYLGPGSRCARVVECSCRGGRSRRFPCLVCAARLGATHFHVVACLYKPRGATGEAWRSRRDWVLPDLWSDRVCLPVHMGMFEHPSAQTVTTIPMNGH